MTGAAEQPGSRFDRVRELFDRAVGLTGHELSALLESTRQSDPAVAGELEELLAADRDPLTALDPGDVDDAPDAPPSSPELIGSFRVLRKLGEGGMGVVYLAEQDQPRRRVAVKVVKTGLVGEDERRRFDLEAQVLGWLNHPGIAQIYEAGTDEGEDGARAYLAMELVDGEPITHYAKRAGLSVRERLQLLAKVADAVQHAHQKGVVHRDLKPGNVLVTRSGEPKVLDFGVARITSAAAQDAATAHTLKGQVVGTMGYMSPEQVRGEPAAVDVRADVWALGVIAYELLAHKLPHDLAGLTLPAAAQAILDQTATRLGQLDTRLSGDIEVIVGKALEKDPQRRYPSADELSADLRRYLSDQPITARPPSTWYQLAKFARRHRALVGGSVALVVVLVAGIVATSIQARLAHERYLDAEAARSAAAAKGREAEERLEEANAVTDFLQRVVESARPDRMGHDVKMLDAIRAAEASIGAELAPTPAREAAVRQMIGSTYRSLSDLEAAEAQLRRAVAIRDSEGHDAYSRGLAWQALGTLLVDKGEYDEAETVLLAAADALAESGAPVESVALALNSLAALRLSRGETATAIELYRRAVVLYRDALGAHRHTAVLLSNLASALHRAGDVDGAAARFREALDILESLDERPVRSLLATRHDRASLLLDMGELDRGEAEYRAILAEATERLPERDALKTQAMLSLGRFLQIVGRNDEAEQVVRPALEAMVEVYGDHHPRTALARSTVAAIAIEEGRLDEAEEQLGIAERDVRDVLLPTHVIRLLVTMTTVRLRLAQGRFEDAVALSSGVLDLAASSDDMPIEHEMRLRALHGRVLWKSGQEAAGEAELVGAYDALCQSGRRDRLATRVIADSIVELYVARGNAERARRYRAHALRERRD